MTIHFTPTQETALSEFGALGVLLMWLKDEPGWGEADGMTREDMIKMIEREMDNADIEWEPPVDPDQLELF